MGEHRAGEASFHLARRNLAPGGAAASGAGGGATSPRRWGDAAPGLGARPRRRDQPGGGAPWLHTQGLGLASWLQDTTSPSLLLPSFL